MGLVGMGLWETGLPRRDGRDAVGQLSFVISPSAGRTAKVGRRAWLFALLLWRSALRQAEALDLQWRDLNFTAAAPTTKSRKGTGGRSRVVWELADAFQSVPRGRADDRAFQFSARTAASGPRRE